MKRPEIPINNSLKKEIKEIIRLCEKAIPEYGEKASYFEDAVSEEEMASWEEVNGVKIPESYKEWLRFSSYCQIKNSVANFFGPQYFNSTDMFADLIQIGNLVGDAERICFSKTTKEFVRIFESKVNGVMQDFGQVLDVIISNLRGDRIISSERELELLSNIQERIDRGELESKEKFELVYEEEHVEKQVELFNALTNKERSIFLSIMILEERVRFIDRLRIQAVEKFWNIERDLIKQGQCTRNWIPEQIEAIMNISEATGNMCENAGRAFQIDEKWEETIDVKGNKQYYGRRMLNVSEYPIFAGEYKNLQALNHDEYFYGVNV